MDGFYTFVVGTRTGFAVLRDPVCCKPAVMAETADWVAFGSEYRALADLPGIGGARVWEPEPGRGLCLGAGGGGAGGGGAGGGGAGGGGAGGGGAGALRMGGWRGWPGFGDRR